MINYSRYTTIKVEVADKVATITLNRPQALNAINHTMHVELANVFREVTTDESVNAVVLTGAGRFFSSGGDIKEMEAAYSGRGTYLSLKEARELIYNLVNIEQPVVCALNGHAVALAANLALFCDIVVAAKGALLSDPHVRVGNVAGDGGAIIWPLLLGLNKAKELLLTGDSITAEDAERLGMVNKVVPQEEVYSTSLALARRLAKGPRKAIRWTKHCLNKRLKEELNLVFDASLALEFAETYGSADNLEGVKAILEKREPHFEGT